MRSFLIPAFFLALFISAARAQSTDAAAPNDSSPQTPFQVAQDLAARGRLDKAMAELDKLAAETPEQPGVERLRGIIFYQQEHLPQAEAAFAKAMEQYPGDLESTEMRGVSLFRLGHAPEAIPYLEKAHTAVDRANIDPQYVLGLCYIDVQRYDDARRAFATQYGFAPDSAEAHLLAGRLFLRREAVAEAVNQVNKALVINPNLPLAHQLLGEAALAKGDSHTAVKELEAERKINPLSGITYDRLGDAYLRACLHLALYPARRSLPQAQAAHPGAALSRPRGKNGPRQLHHAQPARPGLQSHRPGSPSQSRISNGRRYSAGPAGGG
jgi:predicted Zn-dependent protease